MPELDQQLTEHVLQKLRAGGDDLSTPRPVNFQFLFASESNANTFARAAAEQGSTADISDNGDLLGSETPWDVNVAVHIKPDPETVWTWENRLARLAELHQGRADGWFCQRLPSGAS